MSNNKKQTLEKYLNNKSTSYYTPLFENIPACSTAVASVNDTFLAKAFSKQNLSKEIDATLPMLLVKIAGITVISGAFGMITSMIFSGINEFQTTNYIDQSRSHISQIKQHYYVTILFLMK